MNISRPRVQRSRPSAQPELRAAPRWAVGRVALQLICGLVLVGIAWPLAWWGPAPVSNYTFFPLWLGYILTVDGLIWLRANSSPLTRAPRRFAELFLLSIPLWWAFEVANYFLGNWHYLLPRHYGFWVYHLLSSLSFSVVIPAILVTAELYGTTRLRSTLADWTNFAPSRTGLKLIAIAGFLITVASLALPDMLFPLVWIGVFFTVDPINRLRGWPSLAEQVAAGRWSTVLILFTAGLTCGFFWEMWNYWSMPKWTYQISYAGWLKVFEMPFLGYGGYLPFALEIYSIYFALTGLLGQRRAELFHFDERRSAVQD
jgi:hypothetical protein